MACRTTIPVPTENGLPGGRGIRTQRAQKNPASNVWPQLLVEVVFQFERAVLLRVSLVIKVDFGEREILTEIDPATFYITEHYRRHRAMLVRMGTAVAPSELHCLFEQLPRRHAPKRAVIEYDGKNSTASQKSPHS